MQVKDVMFREVEACSPGDEVNRAAQIMWERDCGVVPVVDAKQRVVGMITDRDACMAAHTKGRPLAAIRVGEVMSRNVRPCRPEDTLATAESAMRARRVRRLPVTDPHRRLVGILSLNDLARRAAADRGKPAKGLSLDEVAEMLASECHSWGSLVEKPAAAARAVLGSKESPVPQR